MTKVYMMTGPFKKIWLKGTFALVTDHGIKFPWQLKVKIFILPRIVPKTMLYKCTTEYHHYTLQFAKALRHLSVFFVQYTLKKIKNLNTCCSLQLLLGKMVNSITLINQDNWPFRVAYIHMCKGRYGTCPLLRQPHWSDFITTFRDLTVREPYFWRDKNGSNRLRLIGVYKYA